MHKNQSVNVHQFAMVPKAEIPRSTFDRQFTHKTTFDAGYLIPIYVDEVLPGDSFNMKATFFARMSTPIFPLMDNLYLDSFFFFVPNRLLWDNWKKFMGEQTNPGDSVSFQIPSSSCPAGGYAPGSIFDYMGLPTVGQVGAGATIQHSVLPLRAYNLIWNEWFRDQNLQLSIAVPKGDNEGGFSNPTETYALMRRGKRHDYFTSCLPWTQKTGNVLLPLGDAAPIRGIYKSNQTFPNPAGTNPGSFYGSGAETIGPNQFIWNSAGVGIPDTDPNAGWVIREDPAHTGFPGIYADLSAATSATINQLRQAFQIQKLLERDARGGTRYTEIVRSHFGVVSPDARLQRPEYLGGGSSPVSINPVTQTAPTGAYADTPIGTQSAYATITANNHGFNTSFTEHGVIIGLISVRADLNYQQGLHKMWSRSTRYDFYFPAFAMLGEQAVLNREIYCDGSATDDDVFGYQERWAEYRYKPSQISGLFKSTTATPLDAWHLAQRFTSVPTLNATFIQETPPMERILAIGAEAGGSHFILDSFFDNKVTRTMPLYSVPGLIDHF